MTEAERAIAIVEACAKEASDKRAASLPTNHTHRDENRLSLSYSDQASALRDCADKLRAEFGVQ